MIIQMDALISLIAVYVLACAILPALVARLRGHDARGMRRVFAIGLLTGWTVYGALWAWTDAFIEPDTDVRIIIR